MYCSKQNTSEDECIINSRKTITLSIKKLLGNNFKTSKNYIIKTKVTERRLSFNNIKMDFNLLSKYY